MIQLFPDFLCCVTSDSSLCSLLLHVGIIAVFRRSTNPLGPPRSVDEISRNGERYSSNRDSDASSDSGGASIVRRPSGGGIRGSRL